MEPYTQLSSGAIIDPTERYRYSLWRVWNPNQPRVAFIMLNPSRADATHNDPTIRRCIGFAQAWGYGALEVLNLFAYRTPYPHLLRQAIDPIGADNDRYLLAVTQRVQTLIFAWGNQGSFQNRQQTVIQLLQHFDHIYCLGTTRSGQPYHPLYLKSTTQPIAFQVKLKPEAGHQ